MSDAKNTPNHRGRVGSRRRRWLLIAYAVLLAASTLYRVLDQPEVPESISAYDTVTPTFNRQGPLADEGVNLAYLDLGPRDAPVVLLLHGSPGDKENFTHLLPHLTDRYRVIAPDLPGFGRSDRWIPSYSTTVHARYVLALIDELDIENAHVFGFSMGSGVALDMVDLAPQRIRSLTFYGGVGIQEGEGTGDYGFEHFKYTVGYGLLVWPPELLPHFGKLGSPGARHAFFRNFNDTDQRPFRGILESLNDTGTPLLVLHGRDDFLVPAWTAEQHHAIVEHSELVMFDGGHLMLFEPNTAQPLADAFGSFVERYEDPDAAAIRRTVYMPGAEVPKPTVLPLKLNLGREVNPWLQCATIIGATYILEDPTTITVGLMVRDGQLDLVLAVMALFVGLFTGDLGLYLLGWFGGRRALRWGPIAKRVPSTKLDAMGRWFDSHGWTAVLASRFIPGTRLPLYVAAGATGRKPGRFALWTAGAVAIWTVVMVALVVLLGEAAAGPFKLLFGESWWAVVAAVLVLLLLARLAMYGMTWTGRRKLWVKVSRLWRREFWPAWVFYLPLVPYLAWLSLKHRSLTVWTLANPGLPHGGVVGESKHAILEALGQHKHADVLIGGLVHSADETLCWMDENSETFPVILKPDAAQRGAGVRVARGPDDVARYFERTAGPVLVQCFHPGPFEAGVFYLRYPHEDAGRIFAVTDKHFPVITGNGRDTLERLVWSHPRFRMQADVFLRRLGESADRVPADGEAVPLGMAGNHCQGTKFTDGAHLITPELTAAVDAVAKRFDGFFFGRFDLRYADVASFTAGRDLHVVELNGVTSEATNIYDPHRSARWAYGVLFAQWRHAFAIGAANRGRLQQEPPSLFTLLREVRRYYRSIRIDPRSD